MPVSEAKKRANYKWEKKNYKRVNLAIPFSEYDILNKYCEENSLSKNSFFLTLMREKLDIPQTKKED